MPAVLGRSLSIPAGTAARDASVVFLVVLLASLFGILTRPVGFLAAVWPANAILLGMMVRNPALSAPAGWAAAFTGYVAADLVTGGGLVVTLWLTLANLAGVAAGYMIFRRLPAEDRQLRRPVSIVCLFATCALAASVAALIGGGAARLLFGRDLPTGIALWFTTEMVNMIVFLPVILTSPAWKQWRLPAWRETDSREWLPVMALAISIAGGLLAGGPGAFAYPIPALLWCALTYRLFGTAVLTACFSIVQLVGAASGLLPLPANGDELMMSVSIRLAIALIALGPLAVASINATRNELLSRVQHAADHDCLTGALVRRAFIERGQRLLTDKRHADAIALMVDVDHFKSVNDRHGHATGDAVLVETARTIRANLRDGDLFGRLGGEEFGIVLARSSRVEAEAVAENIRAAVERLAFDVGGKALRITVSIGLAAAGRETGECLYALLACADKALYEAKTSGRNRVITAPLRGARSRRPAA